MYEMYFIDAEGKACEDYAPVRVPETEIGVAIVEALRWMGGKVRKDGWQVVTRYIKEVK